MADIEILNIIALRTANLIYWVSHYCLCCLSTHYSSVIKMSCILGFGGGSLWFQNSVPS